MSDDAKPKASFLGGKAATPASSPQGGDPASPAPSQKAGGGGVGFLRGKGDSAASPIPAPAPAAPVAQPPVMQEAPPQQAPKAEGNRALAQQYLDRGLNHYDRQEIEEAFAAYAFEAAKQEAPRAGSHDRVRQCFVKAAQMMGEKNESSDC